jgi:nitroimidazol reductase NimA-like FMN-containing flavoprotein (pyridoxamine 5'-phosphate oxidase superfamily)
MAAYGVPADLTDALPWSWAQERLVRCRNYWFVTADAAGRPSSMPLWGVWLPDEQRFVCSGSPTSRKMRNIAANPHVCVTIDDTVECVSVEGTATVMTDEADRRRVAEQYAQKYAELDERPGMVEFVLSHTMAEVRPVVAFGIIEREVEFATRATRWRW